MTRIWADAILVIHCAFILFVVGGLALTVAGLFRRWRWVRNVWFRGLHLLAIAVVVLEAWCGLLCPLTAWESDLRAAAGQGGYAGNFIAHWVGRLVYYDLPPWVFTAAYTVFALLVMLTWALVPPRQHPGADE